MHRRSGIISLLFLTIQGLTCVAQEKPFWSEIKQFKRQDSIQAPPRNAILFIGSSSFRLWNNIEADFPGKTIINRGFGGSGLADLIRYADDILFPYAPKQIVIYCGENDIASSGSSEKAIQHFKELVLMIRKRLADSKITYISMKPSPSRKEHFPEIEKANEEIKDFLSSQANTEFIDVYYLMLGANGKPIPDLYKRDSLHMTRKGYVLWQKAIEPHLVR
jgi:lysophospholipase L1-like esterase